MPEEFQSGATEEVRWVETTEHVTTSADPMVILPHGGNPTGPNIQYQRGPSDEVTADLTVNDNPARNFTVSAGVQNVVRYGIYDKAMESPTGGRWTASFDTGVLTTLSTVVLNNLIHAASGTPFAALSSMVPCPVWICRGGSSPITGRPVIAKAVLNSGADLQLETDGNNGITLTAVSAGDSFQVIHSGTLKHGTEHIYGIVERAQLGVQHFHGGFGMIGTSLQFSGQKGQDPTFQLAWSGVGASVATATFGAGTFVQPPAWHGFNFGSDFKHFREGGALVTSPTASVPRVQQLQWTWGSAVTAIDPAGQDGPYGHQKNRYTLTGSLNLYTNNGAKAVLAKVESKVDSSLFYALQRTEGGVTNAYVPWIPLVQYEVGPQEGGGADGVLTTNLSFMSAKSPTYGCQFCLGRFTGVPLSLV